MSVRLTIILLALPLFLLLAGVNSVLLYRQETSGVETGLREQALAAAVTVAEFAREAPDPAAMLTEPRRLSALRSATASIPGLTALYLERSGARPLDLIDGHFVGRPGQGIPDKPRIYGSWRDPRGRLLITAVAPVDRRSAVVAHVDAQSLTDHSVALKRLAIGLVGGSTALALLLGLIVGRQVARELRRTRGVLASHGQSTEEAAFRIREVGELADAIRLIDRSTAAEIERLGTAGEAMPAIGIAALRAEYMAPISATIGGHAFAIRAQARARAGCFHILQADEQGYAIAIGEIPGEPAQALAAAIALRDFVVAGPRDGFADRLAFAARAFGATRLLTGESGGPAAFALDDAAGAAAIYAAQNAGLDPEAMIGDLLLLLPDSPAIAVVERA